MADEKPTDGARVVPLDLSIERRLILRHQIEIWRAGDREDLAEAPDEQRDPDRRRRVAAYERLIEALTRGRSSFQTRKPAPRFKRRQTISIRAEEWEETRAIHDAQRALLAVLESNDEETASPAPAADSGALDATAPTTRDDDLAVESAVLRRVLDVHPARLTTDELIREMAGDAAEFGDRDAVERAVRDLGGVGLLHARELVTPTRAVVRRVHLHAQEGQEELFAYRRHFAFLTNRDEDMHTVDADHRDHAEVELAIRDSKDQALAHFPSGRFNANAAGTVIACLAHDLSRWVVGGLGLEEETRRTSRTIRRWLVALPGRLTRTARRWTLRPPGRWPWRDSFAEALERIRALPSAA